MRTKLGMKDTKANLRSHLFVDVAPPTPLTVAYMS
jgi:hypothetical protein